MTSGYDWSGAVGDVWAREWRRTDRSFADLAPRLDAAILAAAPSRAFRAADLGCGAGATSLALARARPDGEVTGSDLSAELLTIARERAGGAANLRFIEGDALAGAESLAPLDLLVSRHGLMFFADPAEAFARLRAAAGPNRAIVFSCFRDRALNPWAEEVAAAVLGEAAPPSGAAPGPFAFADPDRVRGILSEAGWRAVEAMPVDYSYRAGEGADPVADALDYFARIGPAAPLLRAADPAERPAMLDRLAALCDRHRTGDAVDFRAAAWIWSARA